MNNILQYKDKNIGILGAGKSGLAAAQVLTNSKANIFIFDDNYPRPTCIHKSNWLNYKLWPWKQLSSLVVSPSIPTKNSKKHDAIKLAIRNNVKIINEIDLFFETEPKAKIVGITGTNGKSTTVALLYHILNFNKIKCVIGGNYGYPACLINDPGREGVIILELSSYQLDGTKKLWLDLASIINITPDHFDFHETFEKYVSSKLKIISCLKKNGTLIINKKDLFLKRKINHQRNSLYKLIKVSEKVGKNFVNDNDHLRGTHNSINASIAISLAIKLNISKDQIKSAIKSFKALPHRMEPVFINNKLKIINDSKSTNGESTAAALSSFDNIFWIVGGMPKSDGIGNAKNFLSKVVEVFIIGKSANYFEKEILQINPDLPININVTLEKATQLAIKKSTESKLNNCVVLFSPSAASFDQFKNFEQRGNQFKEIVKTLLNMDLVTK